MGIFNIFRNSEDEILRKRKEIKRDFDRHCYLLCKEAALKIHTQSHIEFYEGDLFVDMPDDLFLEQADKSKFEECKFEAHIVAFSLINYYANLKFNLNSTSTELCLKDKLLNSVMNQLSIDAETNLSFKATLDANMSGGMLLYIYDRVVMYTMEIHCIQTDYYNKKFIYEEDDFYFEEVPTKHPYHEINAYYNNPFIYKYSDLIAKYIYNPCSNFNDGFIEANNYIKNNLIIPS